MKLSLKWIIVIILLLFLIYSIVSIRNTHQSAPSATIAPPTESIPTITKEELSRGWYWGSINQKKSKTPDSWIYSEAGRSSCWHIPASLCP